VFTIGRDGHLWCWTAAPDGWAWVDHGTPAGRAVKSGTGPVTVSTPAGGLAVPVLADDGRVWVRAGTSAGSGPQAAGDWTWTDRGVPPGQLVYAIIGGAIVSSSLMIAVITPDGHVWASTPAGSGYLWTDLGTPGSPEKLVAGIGLYAPAGAAGAADIVALGAPSGQIWTARWSPGSAAPPWTPRGRPAAARVLGSLGTMSDPASPDGTLVLVIGNDQQVWQVSTAGPAPAWTRWDPVWAGSSVTSGRAAVLLNHLPCAVVLDQDKRAVIASAPPS
jgi:hypothetical protein